MRPECTHILPTGRKCRALALRGHQLCFHHGRGVARAPQKPRNPFSRIARWRDLSRSAPTLPASDIPFNVYIVLGSLIADGEDGISDREAGRLLRILLRRFGSIPFPPPAGVRVEPEPLPTPVTAPPAGSGPGDAEFTADLLQQMIASLAPNGPRPTPGPELLNRGRS